MSSGACTVVDGIAIDRTLTGSDSTVLQFIVLDKYIAKNVEDGKMILTSTFASRQVRSPQIMCRSYWLCPSACLWLWPWARERPRRLLYALLGRVFVDVAKLKPMPPTPLQIMLKRRMNDLVAEQVWDRSS